MNATPPRKRDREVLRRLAGGDTTVLEELWLEHADRLYRHALWITRSREEAQDIVQSIFVRLAGRGAELLGIRDLRAYLGTMTHHEALAAMGRRAGAGDSMGLEAVELIDTAEDPGEGLDRRRLAGLVASLPLDQREAVYLHLWGGFSFREIGRMTGVSLFTAASRYRLGLARLRARLMEEAP